ncbi:hypothetical protein [Pedobacter nutrimenti]|jgi:hypothetical protein|uniref:Lipoprotein n=1 Tax=Pedobacter nutrimenti TaxID=1241337 RepID=A0A318UKM2_9SPHI|nr:hypothetical protein [Pedobacter nutrimenti]PYF75927.1 hypothetical protein B0O44_102483 [Pedobacter nutrimenti]
MFYPYKKLSGAFCFLCLFIACTTANNKPVLIRFSPDSGSVVVSGIHPAGLQRLKSLPETDSTLNELVSVLQTPSEQDSLIREKLVKGHFELGDSSVVFHPEQPFVKGRTYLVVTYLNAQFGAAGQMMKGQLHAGVKPMQKILKK